MADNGIIIIGDQTVGYSERQVYVYWDIAPDVVSNRYILFEEPYYSIGNGRYTSLDYIQSIYTTRWTFLDYEPTPISERFIFLYYATCVNSDRYIYYYPETRDRLVFVEGLFTNTPLLMKYPKYYNWNYVPQVLNPEFILWSYYPLSENDITVKLLAASGASATVNSGTSPSSFKIENIADKQYKITVNIDYSFNSGDTVTCYITAYDTKGNYLKPGMW